MAQSQPPPRSPSAKSMLAPPPSVTSQRRPTTPLSVRLPLMSPVAMPWQPLPTTFFPSTGRALLTPEAVLALEASLQAANKPAQLPLPRLSPRTPAGALDNMISEPRRLQSRQGRHHGQPRRRPKRVSGLNRRPWNIGACATYEALAEAVAIIGSFTHQLHLPCIIALRRPTYVTRRAERP